MLLGAFTGAAAQHLVFEQQTQVTGPAYCQPVASVADGSGNVIVTGTAESKVLTEKFSPEGGLLYRNEFDLPPTYECFPQQVAQDSTTGDAIVAGYLYDDFNGYDGIFVLSIKTDGTTRWKVVDTTCTSVDGLLVDPSGNPILLAETGGYADPAERLFKLQGTTGGKLIDKNLSLGSDLVLASCLSLVQDGNGNLYALIDYENSTTEGTEVVSCSEATGNQRWTSQVGGLQLLVLPGGKLAVFSTAEVDNAPALQLFVSVLSTTKGAYMDAMAAPLSENAEFLSTLQVGADSTGAMYFSAAMEDELSFSPDIFQVGKLTSTGDLAYIRTLSQCMSTPSFQVASSGDAYLAYPMAGSADTLAGALDPNGNWLWEHATTGYPGSPSVLLSSGGLSIAGVPYSYGYSVGATSGFSQGYQVATLNPSTGALTKTSSDDPVDTQNSPVGVGCADPLGNLYTCQAVYGGLIVRKRAADGSILWNALLNPGKKNYGGYPVTMQYTSDGHVVVAFYAPNTSGVLGAGLASLEAENGAVNWYEVYTGQGNIGYSLDYMNCDSVGHIVIAGSWNGYGTVTQFNRQNGAKLWEYTTSAPMSSFAADGTGGTVMCGNDVSYTGYQVARVDVNGNEIYSSDIPLPQNPDLYFFAGLTPIASCDPAGDAYIGYWDYEGVDVHLDTYSSQGLPGAHNGSEVLVSQVPGFYYDYSPELIYDSNNQALYVAANLLTDTAIDVSVSKVSQAGVKLWSNIFANSNLNNLDQMALDSSGNVVMLGQAYNLTDGPTSQVTWLRKLTPSNVKIYQYNYAGSLNNPNDIVYGLAIGSDNEPFVFGGYPSAAGVGSYNSLVFKIGENIGPVVENSKFTVAAGALTTIDAPGVFTGASNIDGASAVLVSAPSHAASFTLNSDGSFDYEPASGFTGTDTFTFRAVNAYGKSAVATVTVTVSH